MMGKSINMLDWYGCCEINGQPCDGIMCEICDVYKEWKTGWRYNDDGDVCEGRY